jgi:hypothetical protein
VWPRAFWAARACGGKPSARRAYFLKSVLRS